MAFSVNERVVYPGFGVGVIMDVVRKSLVESESLLYYEITGSHSTLWVPVDEASSRGLRRLNRPEDLPQLRSVLASRPEALDPDFRQRQKDVRDRLKSGILQDLCAVVRDLSGRGWRKALSGYDAEALRKSSQALCLEWAAVDRCSAAQASTEVTGLLQQARQAYGA